MVAHKCRALHPALSTPLVVLALAIALPHVTANLQDKLAKVKQVSQGLASTIETSYSGWHADTSTCQVPTGYDMCATKLENGKCDAAWGSTLGCGCAGKALDKDAFGIKVLKSNADFAAAEEDARQMMCFAGGEAGKTSPALSYAKEKAAADEDLKWMYFGATSGASMFYPGYLWGFDGDGQCGVGYDPRVRPWYAAGVSGPKDVILVFDNTYDTTLISSTDRDWDYLNLAAKMIIQSLTPDDRVSVVSVKALQGEEYDDFSLYATSPNEFLVPATFTYRTKLVDHVASLGTANGVNSDYLIPMRKAFAIANASDVAGRSSNCNRVYVFFTGARHGGNTAPYYQGNYLAELINANRRATGDMFFFVGASKENVMANLADSACQTKGVYVRVGIEKASGNRRKGGSSYSSKGSSSSSSKGSAASSGKSSYSSSSSSKGSWGGTSRNSATGRTWYSTYNAYTSSYYRQYGTKSGRYRNDYATEGEYFKEWPVEEQDVSITGVRDPLDAIDRYLALADSISGVKDTNVRFSEPYISIPNIFGMMVTASTPVYDKSKTPWSLLGIAAVDVPMCTLEAAAEAAGIRADPPPEQLITQQGCACLDTFTWEGESFSKQCTTFDWAVPWCATTEGCGICGMEGLSPSTCWDECDVANTVKGKVEAELRRQNAATCHIITPSLLEPCALEALRMESGQNNCGSCEAENATAYQASFSVKQGDTGNVSWPDYWTGEKLYAPWGKEGFQESFTPWEWTYSCDTIFDATPCEDACDNMLGTCVKQSCKDAAANSIKTWTASGDTACGVRHAERDLIIAIVCGSVGGLLICCCCAYFMFFREKGADSGTEMQGRDGIKPRTDEEAALPQETQETGQDTGNNVPQETQETNGQNVFCSQCGKTVGKDKRFCGGCGAPVAD